VISQPGLRTSGPVVAFREFEVRRGQLFSLAAKQAWTAGTADARCERVHPGRMPHLAPAPGCTCGVHGVDSLATLERYLRWHDRGRLFGGRRVTGAVLIWGSPGRPVLAGELRRGSGLQFRAPHAQVVALADSRLARRVGKRMNVPVVSRAGLEVFAREVSGGVQLRPGAATEAAAEPADQVPAVRREEPSVAQAITVLAKALLRLVWAIVRGSGFVAWTVLRCFGYSLVWLTPRVMSNPIGALVWTVLFAGAALGVVWAVDTVVVSPLLHLVSR
jgi:hypothetical protein